MNPRPIWQLVVGVVAILVLLVAGFFGLLAAGKAFNRYQKRADANNNVKVTAIQIRNQEQRVKIAQQKAQIRLEEARGIRKAQDEIQATLTPLYVQFEAYKAMERLAESGKNSTLVFVPTNPETGLPVVPGITEKAGK